MCALFIFCRNNIKAVNVCVSLDSFSIFRLVTLAFHVTHQSFLSFYDAFVFKTVCGLTETGLWSIDLKIKIAFFINCADLFSRNIYAEFLRAKYCGRYTVIREQPRCCNLPHAKRNEEVFRKNKHLVMLLSSNINQVAHLSVSITRLYEWTNWTNV